MRICHDLDQLNSGTEARASATGIPHCCADRQARAPTHQILIIKNLDCMRMHRTQEILGKSSALTSYYLHSFGCWPQCLLLLGDNANNVPKHTDVLAMVPCTCTVLPLIQIQYDHTVAATIYPAINNKFRQNGVPNLSFGMRAWASGVLNLFQLLKEGLSQHRRQCLQGKKMLGHAFSPL